MLEKNGVLKFFRLISPQIPAAERSYSNGAVPEGSCHPSEATLAVRTQKAVIR